MGANFSEFAMPQNTLNWYANYEYFTNKNENHNTSVVMHIQQTHAVPNEIPPTCSHHSTAAHPVLYTDISRCSYYVCIILVKPFILTLQENIFDVHHLVGFPVNVWQYTKCLLQMYPIVQAWHIFMHASFYY